MIIGAHFLLYSQDAEADRAFFRDVLGFRYVDVGGGWLIFALPPAEAAVHPADKESSEGRAGHHAAPDSVLYLMVDDVNAFTELLKTKGVQCGPLEQASWGLKTAITLPGGSAIGLYQPRHQTAFDLKATRSSSKRASKNSRAKKSQSKKPASKKAKSKRSAKRR